VVWSLTYGYGLLYGGLDGTHGVLAMMVDLEALHNAGHNGRGWHIGISGETSIAQNTRIREGTSQSQSLHKGIGIDAGHL